MRNTPYDMRPSRLLPSRFPAREAGSMSRAEDGILRPLRLSCLELAVRMRGQSGQSVRWDDTAHIEAVAARLMQFVLTGKPSV